MKGIPSDQIQDTILRNGLGEGNRKETKERETSSRFDSVWRSCENKGSPIAFTAGKEVERDRVIFRYQSHSYVETVIRVSGRRWMRMRLAFAIQFEG